MPAAGVHKHTLHPGAELQEGLRVGLGQELQRVELKLERPERIRRRKEGRKPVENHRRGDSTMRAEEASAVKSKTTGKGDRSGWASSQRQGVHQGLPMQRNPEGRPQDGVLARPKHRLKDPGGAHSRPTKCQGFLEL